MFDPKTLKIEIDGTEITLRELAFKDIQDIGEDADVSEIIVKSWAAPGSVTIEEIGKWPNRVTNQIMQACLDLNGLSGND